MFLTPSRPEFCWSMVISCSSRFPYVMHQVSDANGEVESYLALDDGAPLEELGDDLVVLGCAELSLELALGGAIHHALVALPVKEKSCQPACSESSGLAWERSGLTCG